MLPIYHLFLFAIRPRIGAERPAVDNHPTLQNFRIVFQEQHHYLEHFWLQNVELVDHRGGGGRADPGDRHRGLVRRRPPQGARSRLTMNLALLTYFIPAAFLAVPMYKTMGVYRLLDGRWSLIPPMVPRSPRRSSIWVSAGSMTSSLELDEAAEDGWRIAAPVVRLVFPLMTPSGGGGHLSLLLASNECLSSFLLLSNDDDHARCHAR